VRASGLVDPLQGFLAIAQLTWAEARRTRIALAGFVCAASFLVVYGTAAYFLYRAELAATARPLFVRQAQLEVLTLAGLYVANFLTLAIAVMLPVDSISGEIDSGVMETLASKPVARWAIVLGKWFTYVVMTAAYLLAVAGGTVLLIRGITGFMQPHLATALPLMFLGAITLLTLSIAGGTRFSTVTNGIVVFGFYAIAFIGGWIEQIGYFLGNETARYIGTAISLISPVDAMWRLASHEMQPPMMQQLPMSPFSSGSVPSAAMVVWAVGFVVATLWVALRQFRRRPL
jgi:ABC-type transport system involved in multi-copper enzyme maturation permease subunit